MLNRTQQSSPLVDKISDFLSAISLEVVGEATQQKNELDNKNSTLIKAIEINTQKVQDINHTLDEATQQLEDLHKEILVTSKNLNKNREELRDMETLLSSKHSDILEAGNVLAESLNCRDAAAQALTALEKRIVTLKSETKDLAKTNLALELEGKQKQESVNTVLKDLESQVEKLENEKIGIETKIQTLKGVASDLDSKNSGLETAIVEKKIHLDNLDLQIKGFKQQLEDQEIIINRNRENAEQQMANAQSVLGEKQKALLEEEAFIQKAKQLLEEKQNNISFISDELSKQISSILIMKEVGEKEQKELKNILAAITRV